MERGEEESSCPEGRYGLRGDDLEARGKSSSSHCGVPHGLFSRRRAGGKEGGPGRRDLNSLPILVSSGSYLRYKLRTHCFIDLVWLGTKTMGVGRHQLQ